MFENVRIETERTIIRNLTMADLDRFAAMMQSEAVMRFIPDPIPTREQLEKGLTRLIECYAKNRPDNVKKFTVAIEEKKTSELVGWNGFGPLDFDEREIEIYYGFAESHWGKGLATETTRAVMRYAFETVGLKRLVAVVMPANIASIKVAENVGFKFEKIVTGMSEEFADYEGDRYYSLTRDEYLAGLS